jgi:hypothetical protein
MRAAPQQTSPCPFGSPVHYANTQAMRVYWPQALIKACTWEPGVMLTAVPPLPMAPAPRHAIERAMAAVPSASARVQFAVLLAGTKVVALVTPRRTPMHPQVRVSE